MKSSNTIIAGAALSFGIIPYAEGLAKSLPNILIIMTDQQRPDLMPRESYPLPTTPFIDSLARQGTWFNKAYTAAPASAPARVSMLTGRFPSATHVRSNHNIADAYYTKDLFDVAREQGYKTALIGKNHSHLSAGKVDYWREYNHLGQNSGDKNERARKFDDFLGTTSFYACLEPSPYGLEAQLPYRMTDDASAWIHSLSGRPFLMWFSIPEPHNPYQTCEPYYSMFPPESLPALRSSAKDRPQKGAEYELLAEMMESGHEGYQKNLPRLRSIYHGMLRLIDDQIERLVGEMKRLGAYDNTIIIFVSDHGDYAGEYGLMKKGVGLDDAITRIPMQWTGPGIIKSSLPHDAHVSITDIFPTLCEAIQAPVPFGVQGRSLWPLLQGKNYPATEFDGVMAEDGYGGMYYTKEDGTDYFTEGAAGKKPGLFFDELNTWTQSGTMHMLRSGNWKLVYDMDGNGRLYDLSNDPAELNNLFNNKACSDMKNKLTEKLLRWELSVQDPLPLPRSRYRFKRNEHNYLFKN
jgi:arylsulfatase A-like enzyme